MSAAMAGSEVAITVESMFSMNRATARISGVIRVNRGTGLAGKRGKREEISYGPNEFAGNAEASIALQ